MKYIKNAISDKDSKCFLCEAAQAGKEHDKENYIFYRGPKTFGILNRFPYNNGHLMFVPYTHTGALEKLTREELAELMMQAQIWQKLMTPDFNPGGWNIGMNIGQCAGAGLETHLHLHMLPRWNGDTNYVPVFTDTKVISQSLDDVYEILIKLADDNKELLGKL